MKLSRARVQNYRSVRDTGWFEVEAGKTIIVGPNEAGKTAILKALQQINAPAGVAGFDVLRDYPRSSYSDIKTGTVKPAHTVVTTAEFALEESDKAQIPLEYRGCRYIYSRYLSNSATHTLSGAPEVPTYGDIKSDLLRLKAHIEPRIPPKEDGTPASPLINTLLNTTKSLSDSSSLTGETASTIEKALESLFQFVEEGNSTEETRYKRLIAATKVGGERERILKILEQRRPVFVLFSNYFRVKPSIHLEHLASRSESKILDDDQYDYGNLCLLKLLGFTARELSNLGKAAEPNQSDQAALKAYRDQLDTRKYQLNAASVKLTNEIRSIWQPNLSKGEASALRIDVDGQYLKVVVVDDLGVEIELDQRSEGFQWLVSFFVVFFAEAAELHANAILLLDEPGLSLHGLKQREFRTTISRLAETNQTLYTTHSPFLVGPDELDLVRVVEMSDRTIGTKVHTTVTSKDPAALLPLQEALGYDLAQSLFVQQANLVLEGLTDYWYLDGTASLLRAAGLSNLNEKIALLPANSASKVVYFATILHASSLKVAALLDSDAAGDQAAEQDTLVHTLGNKRILRTKDAYVGEVKRTEIEDLLRSTLIIVANDAFGWDVAKAATDHPERSIVEIFSTEIAGFSKYKLAKAYLRWTRDHDANELSDVERRSWKSLIEKINKAVT